MNPEKLSEEAKFLYKKSSVEILAELDKKHYSTEQRLSLLIAVDLLQAQQKAEIKAMKAKLATDDQPPVGTLATDSMDSRLKRKAGIVEGMLYSESQIDAIAAEKGLSLEDRIALKTLLATEGVLKSGLLSGQKKILHGENDDDVDVEEPDEDDPKYYKKAHKLYVEMKKMYKAMKGK